MNLSDTLFLDTTLQADRNFNYQKKRLKINNAIKGYKLVSSTYVLGEFIFGFMKSAVTMYSLLYSSESTTEAFARSEAVLRSTARYSRIHKIIAALCPDDRIDKSELMDRLDILIEDTFLARFYRDLSTPLIDVTGCIRAKAFPIKEAGIWKLNNNCTKASSPRCGVNSFFITNSNTLNKIIKLGEDITPIVKMLEFIIQSPKENLAGRTCWKLGDLIICHEAPVHCQIATSNIRDFAPICEVLEKQIFDYNSLIK